MKYKRRLLSCSSSSNMKTTRYIEEDKTIEVTLDWFNVDWDDLPPSDTMVDINRPYAVTYIELNGINLGYATWNGKVWKLFGTSKQIIVKQYLPIPLYISSFNMSKEEVNLLETQIKGN